MAEEPSKQQIAANLIRDDVTASLEKFFTTTRGFNRPEPFTGEPIANETHTAIVWEYSGVHTEPINGIRPTQREVTVRGVTIVDHTGKEPAFHRYIDWAEVMGQLGLTITGRPIATPPFDT
jgi:hypothetical protein